MLKIVVGEDGTVQNATILQSTDHDLDAKAIEAVKQWKFDPATKKGIPVAVELMVEVDFHLYK
jgi:TonB family protein